MQCVILAAGEGTRMRPLTLDTPKPLIEVCGKPILDHIIEALPPEIDELVIVVSYKKEMIKAHCDTKYSNMRIEYCEQENPKGGTGDALRCTKDVLKGAFLFMYGDDIHGPAALKEAVRHEHCMLTTTSNCPQDFGVLKLNKNGTLDEIVEKPNNPPSNFVNIGGWVLNTDIFSYEIPLSHLGEYLLTDAISAYAKDHEVAVISQRTWIPIGYPDDIKKAEAILCPKE